MKISLKLALLTLILSTAAFSGCGGKQDVTPPGSDNPSSSHPDSGNPGSGNPGSGNPGSGNPGSGNPGSGNPGSGNPGSGNPGSGNPGSGNPGPNEEEQKTKEFIDKWQNSTDPNRNVYKNRPGARYDDGQGNEVTNPGLNTNTDDDDKKNPEDNCPYDTNPGQEDTDNDGIGDACDTCPDVPNANDQAANVCRPNDPNYTGTAAYAKKWHEEHDDTDGDGLPDKVDKCKNIKDKLKPGKQVGSTNPDDYDFGADSDSDGVPDECDNCPNVSNPNQKDVDKDSVGDACQSTIIGAVCKTDKECTDKNLGDSCSAGKCVCGTASSSANRLKPNVVLILDVSGSMGTGTNSGTYSYYTVTRMDYMKNALNTFADASYKDFRFAVLEFGAKEPYFGGLLGVYWPSKSKCTNEQQALWLPLTAPWKTSLPRTKEYNSSWRLKNLWRSLSPQCNTPTALALDTVRKAYQKGELNDGTKGRKTIAIILTDGEPTDIHADSTPYEQARAVQAAKDLYDAGVELYVIGMDIRTQNLIDVAKAGSGGARKTYIEVTGADKLAKSLKAIAGGTASCSLTVNTNSNSNNIYVSVNGREVSRANKEFTYNATTHELQLSKSTCYELNNVATPKLDVQIGCDVCVPQEDPSTHKPYTKGIDEQALGLCDGIDNDCDGTVDNGCEKCAAAETCGDNIDNDCDGVVDNGCGTTHKKRDEECQKDSDCEAGYLCVYNPDKKKKVCTKPCGGLGASCESRADCCGSTFCSSGTCSIG